MASDSRIELGRSTLIVGGLALVALGAAASYLALSQRPPSSAAPAVGQSAPAASAAATPGAVPLAEVTVTLSPEEIARAGIEVAAVEAIATPATVRIPATVQPNAYRTVVVTSLAAGRVTRVSAELGDRVKQGQTLAELYSPELADAETRYLATRAELEAHEQMLRRTEKLVDIGAASRQELERVHAEHATATTAVASALARVTLLGVPGTGVARLNAGGEPSATIFVTAPRDGVITARNANAGVNVDAAAALFTVADLSTVWVVGELLERDFARIGVGSPVTVAIPAYPDRTWTGKVSYVDPQMKPETRTGQLRVEIANPGTDLRIGMFVDLQAIMAGTSEPQLVVPRTAVQTIGERSVVYLVKPQEPGTFIERTIELGDRTGDLVVVRAGVAAGDAVVSKGSFSIRAERERLGLRPMMP